MIVNIAFLGMGNIGTGVFQVLKRNKDVILHRDGLEFNTKKILVRTLSKTRNIDVETSTLTDSFEEILNDESISLVVELMGGISPAKEYIVKLLEKGKTVVSANKDLIARHWPELEAAAKKGSAGFYYEASVGGGIPVIKTFLNSLQANRVEKISAIINGTTNYILTKMTENGSSFEDVLKVAQEKGLAEPDPTSDVEGYDAKYKLAILSSLGFHSKVPLDKIYCEGISKIAVEDIEYGKEFGFITKLLAIGKREGNNIEVRVHPTFIPKRHPLASVHDAYNAIFVEGDAVGKLMLYGRGAGPEPTASAIVSDMVFASKTQFHLHTSFKNTSEASEEITFVDNWLSEYYIRLMVKDMPGVLATVAGVFAKYSISVESIVQKSQGDEQVPLIFVTHKAREKDILNALKEIELEDGIASVEGLIRVEK